MTPPPTVEQVQRALDTLALYHERRLRNLEAEYRRALDEPAEDPIYNLEKAVAQQKGLLKRMPRAISRTFVVIDQVTENMHAYALTPGNAGFVVKIDDWNVAIVPVPDLVELANIGPGNFCGYGLVVSVNGGPVLSEAHIETILAGQEEIQSAERIRAHEQQLQWHEQEMEARAQWQDEMVIEQERRLREQAQRDIEVVAQRTAERRKAANLPSDAVQ